MILMDLVKRAGWRAGLLPFAKCVCVYWAAGGAGAGGSGEGSAGVAGAAAKCAPVLCLALLVLLQRAARQHKDARAYCLLVAAGLTLSAAGDALLVWDMLRGGMAAFGLAHAAYLAAFARAGAGAGGRAGALGAALAAAAGGYCTVLRPPAALRPLVPAYALLLAAMAWRGAARAGGGGAGGGSGRCSAAGGALFLVSDALLAWGLFNERLPYQQVLVMSSYYLAQLCIALSALLLPLEQHEQHAPPAPAPAPALAVR